MPFSGRSRRRRPILLPDSWFSQTRSAEENLTGRVFSSLIKILSGFAPPGERLHQRRRADIWAEWAENSNRKREG